MIKIKKLLWVVLCFSMLFGHFAQAQKYHEQNVSTSDIELAVEQRLDFSFQDVPVRALLQVLAEASGVNMVTDESVHGAMTLNLKQASWQEALDVILRTKGLSVEVANNTYFIRGHASLFDSSGEFNNNSGQTEVIELRYQRAEDVRKMIGEQGSKMLSAQGSVSADPLTNQLIIQDEPNRVAKIRSLVKKIDVPARQVLIEARIVEAGDSFSRNLGVKLGFNDLRQAGYTSVPDPTNPGAIIQVPIQSPSRNGAVFGANIANVQALSGQDTSLVNNMINFPAVLSSSVNPASFAVSLFRSGLSQFINLEISALETDGRGRVISSPRVVTSNNVKAIIEQGTEIPYQESTSSGATSVSFRKANLKLEVTPQITPSGEVVMDVDVTKDSVGNLLTSAGYTIDTKHVQTQVKIENGGTIVIGGIYQEESRSGVNKVPWLGSIPLLGYLFKTTRRNTSKTELLIFLTPHLLDSKGQPIINAAKYIDE